MNEPLVNDAHANREDFELTITRHPIAKHIVMGVRVIPMMETFIKGLGNGEARPSSAYPNAKLWLPLNPESPPLMVYQIAPLPPRSGYRLDCVGMDFEVEGLINLSFLRLVGLSKPEGVKFRINGVYSEERLLQLGDRIGSAVESLYKDYLNPIDLSVVVHSGRGR